MNYNRKKRFLSHPMRIRLRVIIKTPGRLMFVAIVQKGLVINKPTPALAYQNFAVRKVFVLFNDA